MSQRSRAWKNVIGISIISAFVSCMMSMMVVLFSPLCETIGCTSTQGSLYFTCFSAGCFFGGLVSGKMFDRCSPKLLVALGSLLWMTVFIGFYAVKNIYLVWVLGVLGGVGTMWTYVSVVQQMVTTWFVGDTGTLLTLLSIPAYIGNIAIPTVAVKLYASVGFRAAALIVGVVCGGIMLLISLICISRAPAYYNAKPVLFTFGKRGGKQQDDLPELTDTLEMPMSKVLRMPSFWMLLACPAILAFATNCYTSNSSLLYQSMGMDLSEAALMISISNASNIVVMPLFGILCDRINPRYATGIALGICMIATLMYPCLNGWLGAVIFALCIQTAQIGDYFGGAVMAKRFGSKNAGRIIGWCFAIQAVGSSISPVFSAYLAEISGGSYRNSMLAVSAACAITIVFSFLSLREPERQ